MLIKNPVCARHCAREIIMSKLYSFCLNQAQCSPIIKYKKKKTEIEPSVKAFYMLL